MRALNLSAIFLIRDWRAGELRLLMAALVIAVAAIASVGFFVDRMRQALDLQSRQLLGADLVVSADRPIDESAFEGPIWRELSRARTVGFPSMVIAGARTQLGSIKAVSSLYPLRGALRVAEAPGQPDVAAHSGPAPGTVWVDPQLLQALDVRVGESVQLGESSLVVSRVIMLEPDRGADFVNFAPRVLMSLEDLPATQLIQPGSRVGYRLLLAGPQATIDRAGALLRDSLPRGQRLEDLEGGRPELRTTVDRAEKFLALVALLTAIIAAVAIGLGARRFVERHLDGCAVMRAIGLSQRMLAGALAIELLWLGLVGGAVGAALGWVFHWGLVRAVASLVPLPLPLPGVLPAAQSVLVGIVLLIGAAAWPILRMAGVPPLRVLRRDVGPVRVGAWASLAISLLAFGSLLFWLAGDPRLAAIALACFVVAALAMLLVSVGLIRLAPLARAGLPSRAWAAPIRWGLSSWSRRRGVAIAQTAALSVGLMALLLLTVIRTDLLESWRKASPADAPNRFVINIQPDQVDAVKAVIIAAGPKSAELFPMVRGRLIAVNEREVSPEAYEDDRARRMVDREFNLSYGEREPAHNQTIAGRWLDPAKAEVSVEQGIAKTLRIGLGDRLTFDVPGNRVAAVVTGIRKLAWDSMKVNFFMVLSPALLLDQPQTWITAYHQRPGAHPIDADLVRRYPNLTVFDVGNLIRQIQAILDQVVVAVQFLFGLTLLAGTAVLYAALASSRDERIREGGLMRALGASRELLLRAQFWELGLAGGAAGLLGAAGALAIGVVLAGQVFQFAYAPRWSILALGVVAGVAVASLAGWIGLRGVLNSPPIRTLREA